MCTVSWLHHSAGYELFCNRDERRSRAAANGPTTFTRDGIRFLAPVDGLAGGTWIGVNEFGIAISLLNGRLNQIRCEYRSRGLLLPELLSARTLAEVVGRFWSVELEPYASFTMLVLEPGLPSCVLQWDGRAKTELGFGEACRPLTSSSVDPEGVAEQRRLDLLRRRIEAGGLDAHVLEQFHGSHGAATSAYSTCMHREDAETVSFSRILVTSAWVEFFYSAGPPCRSTHGEVHRLPRVLCSSS